MIELLTGPINADGTQTFFVRGAPPEDAGESMVVPGDHGNNWRLAVELLKEKARYALAAGTRFEIRQALPGFGEPGKMHLAWYWSREMNARAEWQTGPVGFDVATGVIIVERCVA